MSSKSKKKNFVPKGDKYADKRDEARKGPNGPDAVNRRWQNRQAELDKQQRGANLLHASLQTNVEVLADWELELIAQAHTGTGNQTAPPMSDEDWGIPMEYTSEGARPKSTAAQPLPSPEERLLLSIFVPSTVGLSRLYQTFGNEMAASTSYDAEREVGAGYEDEEEYSR